MIEVCSRILGTVSTTLALNNSMCQKPTDIKAVPGVCTGQYEQAHWNWILTHNLQQCKHEDILAKYLIIPVLVLQLTNLLAQGSVKIHVLLLQPRDTVKKPVWTEKKACRESEDLSQSCQKLIFWAFI